MILQKIHLKNFRQFKDCRISFSTDEKKNVTVIMGENGTGKTTVEQAFTWCLYGKTTFKVKELINRKVRDSMQNEEQIVCAELFLKHNNQEYRVERSQIYKRQASGRVEMIKEQFKVSKRNDIGDYHLMSQLEIPVLIREFLPSELSDFFFFDGERLQQMSTELLEKKKSKNFREAVHGLVGLSAMREAYEHLGPNTKKNSTCGRLVADLDEISGSDVQELSDKIRNIADKIVRAQEEVEEIEPEINRYRENIGADKQELKNMQTSIDKRKHYEDLERIEQGEEKEKKETHIRMFKTFSQNASRYFLTPMIEEALQEIKVADKLDKGIPHIHVDTIEFLLKRGICICGQPIGENDFAHKHLVELLSTLPPNSLGNSIGTFATESRQMIRGINDFTQEIQKEAAKYFEHDAHVTDCRDKKEVLEKELSNKDKVEQLHMRIAKAEQAIKRLETDFYNQKTDIKMLENNKKRLEKEREEKLIREQKNAKNRQYLRYAEELYKYLQESYAVKEKETREELEKTINQIFEDIYEGGINIAVSSNYNINTFIQDTTALESDELEKNTAQSYAIIFAFISGIIKIAKEKKDFEQNNIYLESEGFPLVMDAPLSAFDKNRIQKICTVLPTIAKQVIIFIKDTDGDVAEEYMSDIIGKKWKLEQVNQLYSIAQSRG